MAWGARRVGRAAAWAGGGAALGALGVAGYTARELNGPKRPWPNYTFTPFELDLPAEEVRFASTDGVELAGWLFRAAGAEATIVGAHGHRGNKSDLLGIGSWLYRGGFNVLLFDFRGNGESADGPQSLALRETADLAAAIDWAAAEFPATRLGVIGFSMGASTAILTAADDPRVEALVLDSPFAEMSDVVRAAYRRYRLPWMPVLPLAAVVTWARYGYRFGQVRPLDVMRQLAPRPVLLLHGTADHVIPVAHADTLAEEYRGGPNPAAVFWTGEPPADLDPTREAGNLEVVLFDGVDHCGGYFADRPFYVERVTRFFRTALAG